MPAESYHDFPLSDNYNWDADAAELGLRRWASSDGSGDKEKIDWNKLKQVYFWHEAGELSDFGQLKFPYCRIEDGRPHVVHNAVQNALARIDGSTIPERDKEEVRRVAERQMARFNSGSSNNSASVVGRPTPEQLAKINRFSLRPLSAEEVFVFPDMMIDNQETAYNTVMHPNILNKFVEDANKGIGLLMNHNQRSLPVGRSFDSKLAIEHNPETGQYIHSVYGYFYIDLGRQTESGMSTDDIVKGITAGTVFDTSIGFNADSWKCSICGNDIRDFMSCPHIPGEKYVVTRDGKDVIEKCIVIVGEDGKGELIENSLVFAGACDRATITKEFSAKGVNDLEKGSKLHLVDNIKNIPLNATIYGYYTKDGPVLFTDTSERTNGAEILKRRSEEQVELKELQEILARFGIQAETKEQLETELAAKVADDKVVSLETELAQVKTELETIKEELVKKDEIITELMKANEELTEKAGLVETYRIDLINKALELGVRAQGNAFQTELFKKFLNTLSIDEIKEVIKGFEAEVAAKFEGARFTVPSDRTIRARNNEPSSRDDFETEEEFRTFVAEKAVEYAKANNVSLGEATKLMYKKFAKGGEE
ncbi:hypothetical protein E308F_29950 [Moorella sp. E308F]|uniref:hypothetical protein n=1 Tax=Moorella sp. E308F TaxID=2572682 RepID=UPI0010FFC051|nr:hypothetical protein [Moorella sp. E308F]GEA16749.1 hypothetical protein E308F_29950 [Moorella sp. E308F]